MPQRLKEYFKKKSRIVDRALRKFLPPSSQSPRKIHQAMRYSVFAGGKRLRPILVMAAAEACGQHAEAVIPTACAMELIHTYSLIHDDLPAMDDDTLRRGRATNHIVFGEAMAILAGDSLLTTAFELISKNGEHRSISAQAVQDVIQIVAAGAGSFGMIGGQVADIESDQGRWKKLSTRFEKLSPKNLLLYIHQRKTSALITASLLAGGRLAQASPSQMVSLKKYGWALGLAFQVKDDILDVIGDKKKLGKRGSDRANQKLTYVSLFGLNKSQEILTDLTNQARLSVAKFGKKADVLRDLADFVRDRDR